MMWNQCLEDVAKKRDREQFRKLFDHFGPLIKAFAYKLSDFNHAELLADELLQETMIKVWRKAGTFDSSKSSASTWIFTIARNTRIDLIRKQQRHSSNISADDEDDIELQAEDIWRQAEDDVSEQIDREQRKTQLLALLDELPEDQMQAIKTIYLEGKSHSEAAKVLQVPLGTIKSRVRLALEKLRFSLDKQHRHAS